MEEVVAVNEETGGEICLEPGEEVQWELLDRGELHLRRPNVPAPSTKSRARK